VNAFIELLANSNHAVGYDNVLFFFLGGLLNDLKHNENKALIMHTCIKNKTFNYKSEQGSLWYISRLAG